MQAANVTAHLPSAFRCVARLGIVETLRNPENPRILIAVVVLIAKVVPSHHFVGFVRAFRDDMFLSSTESKYKIYIIDDAERMTPNAQNALLKVIEEPPSNGIIFLLTLSDDAILTTIKSRTQHVAMQRFDESELERYFKEKGTPLPSSSTTATRELMMCADGRIGRAIELIGNGEILGIENGKPDDLTCYAEKYRYTYNGRAIVYIRANGKITLHAFTKDGLCTDINL